MEYSFEEMLKCLMENDIQPSGITKPLNGTIVYVAKKIEKNIANLERAEGCFVFCEKGITVPEAIKRTHSFCYVDNPTKAFARYAEEKRKIDLIKREKKNYSSISNNSIVGENVAIGKNVIIERNVFIDHDNSIGEGSIIRNGACIRSGTSIGSNCIIGENAVIGNIPFDFVTKDEKTERMYPLGTVSLGDNVEIGAQSIIDLGTISPTRIGENTKVDVFVHIGHDAVLGKNVLVTTTSAIGAFSVIGDNVKVYCSKVMKRLRIGDNATVSYGSIVLRDVKPGASVLGYPAREMPQTNMEEKK